MFNGPTYDAAFDLIRLSGQIQRVRRCMEDGRWRTLRNISDVTRDPEASVSAQLRHLRKERFGSHIVERRIRGDRSRGLYEYRLVGEYKPVMMSVIPLRV